MSLLYSCGERSGRKRRHICVYFTPCTCLTPPPPTPRMCEHSKKHRNSQFSASRNEYQPRCINCAIYVHFLHQEEIKLHALNDLWSINIYNDLSSKYIYIKSTTVYVPRRNGLGLSQPHPHQRVCPSTSETGGGGHTRLRARGWGSHNSDDWRKGLALCLLCVFNYVEL